MKIGQAIKKIRKERGITQAALRKKIGLSRHHFSYMESGQRAFTFKTLEKIAEVVGVPSELIIVLSSELNNTTVKNIKDTIKWDYDLKGDY